jgi:hypothetical protein
MGFFGIAMPRYHGRNSVTRVTGGHPENRSSPQANGGHADGEVGLEIRASRVELGHELASRARRASPPDRA